ncbi:iron-sulfur cluster assembly accessory protein [Methylococcus sp. EFPC2]|uniref:HesB/IscA family protein n=1 Tax=Methylococcus sp. EFPC2 TaxID=2812648 RepID=UPI0019684A3E|nr:iron-sulfur cluster assembly accessory protein [Methylococcus sp. EFPC2]QSA96768.1 iron-sulfur cluster assembly accessory protein [Methylococcus sp. EFPC2]
MSITLTESAAKQIAKQLAKRGRGLGLRLGVKKAGCSGLAYVVDYADDLGGDDQVFEEHGVKLIINASDLPVLDGVQVDYTREGISEAFRFHNPNARASCGCGESFTV